MKNKAYKNWRVVRTVELNASAQEVWDLVGGFFNIHKWHPDIVQTEVPGDQTEMSPVRRLLTFPGQPKTTEELIFMDNENFHYRYKWHEGEWGEKVQRYVAEIKVLELELDERCVVQWSSTFYYFEDALTQFYQNGFAALVKKFG
jgi:hypothetical protein